MKRKFLSWLLAWLCVMSFTFAQNTSVWDVTLRFCNDDAETKNLSLVLEGGKESEICMDFVNTSDNDVTIKYGFVDGTIAQWDTPKKACMDEWVKEKFGQYITQDTDTITILAGETVRQKAKIKYPSWFSGLVNGCLTYYVADAQQNITDDDSMFSILVRRATFVDVLVWWELSRNIKLSEKNPVSSHFDRDSDKFIIDINLSNLWNVDESVFVSGIVSNSFWYEKLIELNDILVKSDSDQTIQVEIDDLPRYKLSYHADLLLISNPKIPFDTTTLSDDIKWPVTINVAVDLFQFPRIILLCVIWGIVVVLLVVYLWKHLKFQK